MNDQDLLQTITDLKLKLRDFALQHYTGYELLSWRWWINIALLIIPILLWWKFVDKQRLMEIIVFGLLVNMIATFLDVAGTNYALWEYPVYTLPHLPLMIPVDYIIVPIVGMFIYQRFLKWMPFLIISVILSAFMAFACEPLAVYMKLYRLLSWRYIYSFPIYFVIYVGARLSTNMFLHTSRSVRTSPKN